MVGKSAPFVADNVCAQPETREDRRKRLRREGMRRLRTRESKGLGLAQISYSVGQVNMAIRKRLLPDKATFGRRELNDLMARIAAGLIRRELGE